MISRKDLERLNKIKDTCTKCGGTGYTTKGDESDLEFIDCSCVIEIIKETTLIESNIPKRYQTWDFRSLNKEFKEKNAVAYKYLREYIQNIEENIESGKGFWLTSPPGLAKSSIICYILREALKKGKVAYYGRTSHLLSKKFEALGDQDSRSFFEYLIDDVDILALEEIEKIRLMTESDMINHLFYEMISDMYDSNKVLLVSSNIGKDDVLKMLPPFVQDRLSTIPCLQILGTSGRSLKIS